MYTLAHGNSFPTLMKSLGKVTPMPPHQSGGRWQAKLESAVATPPFSSLSVCSRKKAKVYSSEDAPDRVGVGQCESTQPLV